MTILIAILPFIRIYILLLCHEKVMPITHFIILLLVLTSTVPYHCI